MMLSGANLSQHSFSEWPPSDNLLTGRKACSVNYRGASEENKSSDRLLLFFRGEILFFRGEME